MTEAPSHQRIGAGRPPLKKCPLCPVKCHTGAVKAWDGYQSPMRWTTSYDLHLEWHAYLTGKSNSQR